MASYPEVVYRAHWLVGITKKPHITHYRECIVFHASGDSARTAAAVLFSVRVNNPDGVVHARPAF